MKKLLTILVAAAFAATSFAALAQDKGDKKAKAMDKKPATTEKAPAKKPAKKPAEGKDTKGTKGKAKDAK